MESLPQDRLNLERPQAHRTSPAILIVDDREENLLVLERLLKQTGAVVVKAQNGNDALKACLNHEFALALLDVNMPEMNGYELAALMRGERNHSTVPIIFVSAAYQQEEQIFQGYSAGAVDYLVKPLREDILLNKVKVFLDIHSRKQDITHLNAVLTARAAEQALANEELRAQSEELQVQSEELQMQSEELQAQSEELQAQHETLIGSLEELQAAEQELRAAHGRINTILEQMSDGFVSFDRYWRYTRINAAAAQALQKAPEQLLGKTIWEMWPQAFDLPLGVNFRRSLQENIPLQFETYYPAPLDRWFECRCHPTTEGLAIFFSDITERRQAEEALQQSEALYRSIGEAIDYGVWLCAPDGRNTYASESLLKMLGSTQEQFSNFGWKNMLHPDDAERTVATWQECVRTGCKWDTELRFQSIDGQWRHVLARGLPVKNEQGEITGWAGLNLDITERKKAEEKLREKEKRLALATSATRIGMFDWNLFRNTVRWTQTHEALFGYAPATTTTTTDSTATTPHDLSRWADRVHPEDLPLIDEELRRCLREHQPLEVQYRIIWPDGSLHWIESKGVFLYEKKDTPNRMLGVVMDITERKQTEEALRQNREDLARAQQVGQIGSWRLDVHRNILTWSDENHRIFGVEKGTPLTYESFLKIIHPDDRQYVDAQWQSALHGEPYDIEHRLLVDGQVKWVREKAYLGFDAEGGLLSGFGITQDITERKQAEKALWESEQRYSTLFKNMLSGLAYHKILFDDQGRPTDYLYLATNRAFADQTGLQNVTGKKVTEVIPEIKKTHPELIEIYGRVATTGKPEKFELYFEPLRKWYVVSAYSQEKNHFITVFDDITERKQAEEYLQTMNATLERKVEERTQELQETQKQLLHREKLSAIGKLSASIAHEFNNPLQGILSTLKGLRKRAKMDDEDAALLDAAIVESDRIKNLIRSLQDFNRPSSDKKMRMDLHHSLDSILLLFKSDFNGKRISVVRDYMERLPQIMAVPDQIKQVLLNLLTNAADACHQSGGVITVSTWQEGDRVAVAIQDTGVGIQSADLAQIFQPFYTTKAEVKGTGLGLSISYGIIENHHGEIRVTSLPGEGATFTVLLPITGSKEEAALADGR